MVNEEIIGGLVSALSRGEPLEKAMMTFFNAGYKKDEIEVSANEVYTQLGPQVMGTKTNLKETIDAVAIQVGVVNEKKVISEPIVDSSVEQEESSKIVLQKASTQKLPQVTNSIKEEDKTPQNVSNYEQQNSNNQYQNADEITNKIVSAIKGLNQNQVNIPSRIEIVHKNSDYQPSTVVQRVSDYSGPQKSVSKAMTYVLIAILLLLLGALAAVFLFKEDLIKLFNNIGLG